MGKKMMLWKTKGMNQDLSVSAFNPEFSFENMNLRLSTNEGNTLMSWVNERGTAPITVLSSKEYWSKEGQENVYTDPQDDSWTHHNAVPLSIDGITIGTAVLNKKLVIFTTGSSSTDRIYSLYRDDSDDTYMGKMLFSGHLNFAADCPLETLVSYESEDIQKVYWVDGRNQPRVINIVTSAVTGGSGVYSGFDFVPEVSFPTGFSASVTQDVSGGGLFAPGVIQYCFCYMNKHGQQSNIVWVSPLYHLTFNERAASPEEKVSNSFRIKIEKADTDYDYVRLYSIQRTSLDLEPFVKLLIDLPITIISGNAEDIVYTDTGTTGATVDPTELLFVGGKEIIANTLIDKDGTLFLGNITQSDTSAVAVQTAFDGKRADHAGFTWPTFKTDSGGTTIKILSRDVNDGFYSHTNTLKSSRQAITTFKGGEEYRLGIQLQKKTGEWTEPIWIDDIQNTHYPAGQVYANNIPLPYASFVLTPSTYGISNSVYTKIRPLIVYPSITDREILCQGVLNPTVFNVVDRKDNAPFAQASWYFRPYMTNIVATGSDYGEITNRNADIGKLDITGGATTEVNNNTYFYTNQLIKYVSVLVADVDSSFFNDIISKHALTASYWEHDSNFEKEITFPFDGIINLNISTNRYAFVREQMWDNNYDSDDPEARYEGYREYDKLVYRGLSNIYVSDERFEIYTGLSQAKKNLLYYYTAINNISQFVFKFEDYNDTDGNFRWQIVFKASGTGTGTNQDSPIVNNYDGEDLRFVHLNSIFSTDDLPDTNKGNAARKIEIQGSKNILENFYATFPDSVKSNTQFFVDQSIVTLNSPDIEFDTDVQRYGTEGLGLRIVGAIPVTSNISAHHIQVSSNMMESGHNTNNPPGRCGRGELDRNVLHEYIDVNAGRRLISEYLWNDVTFSTDTSKDDGVSTGGFGNYLVYPWQRTGSLANDTRTADKAASLLKLKRESNLLYSINTEYFEARGLTSSDYNNIDFANTSMQVVLTENDEVMNYRLGKQNNNFPDINYYANIDKVLYNSDGSSYLYKTDYFRNSENLSSSPVSMKYKSTSHAVVAIKDNKIMPYVNATVNIGEYTAGSHPPYWINTNTNITYSQGWVKMDKLFKTGGSHMDHNFLWLGELYKTSSPTNKFGGNTKSALLANKWMIGGPEVDVPSSGNVTLNWTEGDTYYQRYDCLKTYPFTEEDTNQMVEILSFMCETHVNIDGRYDRNRGQVDNTRMRPRNFNLLNPVYSQRNNFFTYRQLDHEGETSQSYPNHVAYSMSKNSTAERDEWTHVTLANILELDGDKGKLNKLTRFNDQLLAFQDTGISQILYNENTAISSTAGVPIEIANSGKVTGKRYLSDTIGCKNKWSMVNTPTGIYFMDDHDKSIYLFNGQLENLSTKFGFNSWCKKEMTGDVWEPSTFKGFLGCYDKQNQDVLFVNDTRALAFSEKIGAFTSFYDYGKGMLKNLEGEGIWLTGSIDNATYKTSLWGHQKGSYGRFFGENKPYWMTLVGNPEPQVDKMFTNLEFRACVDGEMVEITSQQTEPSEFLLPFDELEVWNEYQHGITMLHYNGMPEKHFQETTNALKRKFRIWRCDIPRDNVDILTELPAEPTPEQTALYKQYTDDLANGIYRTKKRPLDRIRNTWVYLKLMKKAAEDTVADNVTTLVNLPRTEVHDMGLGYF